MLEIWLFGWMIMRAVNGALCDVLEIDDAIPRATLTCWTAVRLRDPEVGR